MPVLLGVFAADHDTSLYTVDALMARMGLPEGCNTGAIDVNALPFRAYGLIYNDWFRDQNLIDKIDIDLSDGPDPLANFFIFKSAKKHDYFTGALPYLQKGVAADILGAITTLDVETLAVQGNEITIDSGSGARDLDSAGANVIIDTTNIGSPMFVDVSSLSVSVNALRESVAIQRLLERDARGGTRYVENIKAQFNVTNPDFRLQRPEFLGGGKSFINISPVANTSDTATVDQGELRGIGTGLIQGHAWAKSFTEHGYIIGIMRARGDITYFQGIEKMWRRSTRYDFYIPALANLGEQSVLNSELFYSGAAADDLTFGYQERWNEYRMKGSKITGKFNPDVAGALSHWHLAEDFAALPNLNATFIQDNTPMARITTVDSEDDFTLDLWFNYKCARPIPVHSIPSLTSGKF